MPVSKSFAARAAASKAKSLATAARSAAATGRTVAATKTTSTATGRGTVSTQVEAIEKLRYDQAKKQVLEREAAAEAARARNRAAGITGPSASKGTPQTLEQKIRNQMGGQLSALEEAKLTQQLSTQRIFDKVSNAAQAQALATGKVPPTQATSSIAVRGVSAPINITQGKAVVVPKVTEFTKSPMPTAPKKTIVSPGVPARAPVSGTLMGAASLNKSGTTQSQAPGASIPRITQPISGIGQRAYLPSSQPIITGPTQIAQGIQNFIGQLVQQLAPGVTARLSVKAKR